MPSLELSQETTCPGKTGLQDSDTIQMPPHCYDLSIYESGTYFVHTLFQGKPSRLACQLMLKGSVLRMGNLFFSPEAASPVLLLNSMVFLRLDRRSLGVFNA